MRSETLWLREEDLRDILAGRKTIEVRVAYPSSARLKVGDKLVLKEAHPYAIGRVARYTIPEELLANGDAVAIAPGAPREELPDSLRSIYPPEKEALSVIAFSIAPAPGDSGEDVQKPSDQVR